MKKNLIQILLTINGVALLAVVFLLMIEKQYVYVPCKHEIIECKPEHGDAIKRMVVLKQRIDEIDALRTLYTGISDKLTKEYDAIETDTGWYEAVEMCARGDTDMCKFITEERERKLLREKKI